MGACPGPTTKALSNEGERTGLYKPENAPVTWVAITKEVNAATGRDELEPVMAGKEGNVETNAGNLNVPDEAARELATTIAWPELTLAITGETLDIGAVFSRTAEMMAGSEFSRAWATATAISLEKDVADVEEAAVTTTGVADDDGAEEEEVKNRPAYMILKVERGWDMLEQKSHDSQNEKGPLATRTRNAMDRKNVNPPHNR